MTRAESWRRLEKNWGPVVESPGDPGICFIGRFYREDQAAQAARRENTFPAKRLAMRSGLGRGRLHGGGSRQG